MARKKVKSILKSRTFWIAVIQGVLGIVAVFATEYPEVGGLLVAKSALDILLRFVTGEPVTFRLK